MDSAERKPSGNQNSVRIDAVKRFNNNLMLQDEKLTNFGLKMYVREFIGATLDYDVNDTDALMEKFERHEVIPESDDILDDEQSAIEWLKVAIFCEIGDLYAINHSKEDFNEWIEPFLRSTLSGHFDESGDHAKTCKSEGCVAEIIGSIVSESIGHQKATIDGNEEYIVFADEIINMNISVVRTLGKLGVYDTIEVENMLEDYEWWMKSLDHPVFYDRNIFKQLKPKKGKNRKPIANNDD
jgi:hypothetical protein